MSLLALTLLLVAAALHTDQGNTTAAASLDRYLQSIGHKQIYGTQLVKSADGKLEPAPLEDPKHVDLRRDAACLPPLSIWPSWSRSSWFSSTRQHTFIVVPLRTEDADKNPMSGDSRPGFYRASGAIPGLHPCLHLGDRPPARRERHATFLPGQRIGGAPDEGGVG